MASSSQRPSSIGNAISAPRVPIGEAPPPQAASEALRALREGNERFVNGTPARHDVQGAINRTSDGQAPFAAVLSCIDSRVPVETIFDLTIGHLFSARVAGNVVSGDVLGSLEYACAVAGTPLVVVLGHTNCGAVKGACDNVEMENLTGLLEKIRPAVDAVETDGERTSENREWVNAVARENVVRSKAALLAESNVLSDLVVEGEVTLVGAMYDVGTGRVTFYDDAGNSA